MIYEHPIIYEKDISIGQPAVEYCETQLQRYRQAHHYVDTLKWPCKGSSPYPSFRCIIRLTDNHPDLPAAIELSHPKVVNNYNR